ncbi:hypothetical protein LOK49_LG14G01176 [Camellia lanceoleosa]|uniref:Uncharacterized protein n=1 Tax=Camellia lanceoleosa TaxID=1840588 RepID=A0ACC0F9R9_9ERIC|nr:hypothetical protein LOK49_LG14G01176 [Camellia lanceoleosa]
MATQLPSTVYPHSKIMLLLKKCLFVSTASLIPKPAVSFHDTLLTTSVVPSSVDIDLSEDIPSNDDVPTPSERTDAIHIKLPTALKRRIHRLWKTLLIIKFVGHSFHYQFYSLISRASGNRKGEHYLRTHPWELEFHPQTVPISPDCIGEN